MEIRKNIIIKNYLSDLNNYDIEQEYENGFLRISENKKIGILDNNGKMIIKPSCKNIVYDGKNFLCVKDDNIELLDNNGECINKLNCNSSFVRIVEKNNKAYLLYDDENDKFIKLSLDKSLYNIENIDDLYKANLHNELVVGLKYKEKKDTFEVINKYGEKINYDFNKWPNNKNIMYKTFDDGIVVKTNNNIILLNNEGLEVNKVRKYNKLQDYACFNDKIILQTDNKLVIINKDGSKEKYDYYNYKIFNNILIIYNNLYKDAKQYIYNKNNKKYEFDHYMINEDKYINFIIDNKHGILDSMDGKIKMRDQKDNINCVVEDIITITKDDLTGFKNLKNGFHCKKKYKLKKDCIINKIITRDYVFFVTDDNNVAVIDSKTGEEVRKFEYKDNYNMIYMGNDMLLFTGKDNYLYNIEKDCYSDFNYLSITSFNNDYSIVKDKNYKYGIIDKNFKVIVPFLFDEIKRIGNNYLIDNKLVDINDFKYDLKLELYSNNDVLLYERKFKKKETFETAYNYFASEIEEYEKRKDRYESKIENEFTKEFKEEDIKKIKRKEMLKK